MKLDEAKKAIGEKMEAGQKWTIGRNDKYASMGNAQKHQRKTFDKARASRKGKGSLNPAQKNRNDSEGQKSYKQEDT